MIFKQPLKGVPNNDSNRRDKNESLTHGGQDNIGPLLFIHIMHKKHTQETQLLFSLSLCLDRNAHPGRYYCPLEEYRHTLT